MILRVFPDLEPAMAAIKRTAPAVAFFAGFAWDALTLGRSTSSGDLWLLAGYLAGAAALLWYLGHRQSSQAGSVPDAGGLSAGMPPSPPVRPPWLESGPYVLLQFLYGGLFSALFIFYFKSSSHWPAVVWALGLGALLVANEFLKDRYSRFTLTWALFGLCAMLLLNFVIPHAVGGLSAGWFILSTLAGAGLAHLLRHRTPGRPGRIAPAWAVAAGLMLAYWIDVIPPVPLVKRDMALGQDLTRAQGSYVIWQEDVPWWNLFRNPQEDIRLGSGQRLYCVSSIFAPAGLKTRLYHRWLYRDPTRGWLTTSRIGFDLSGGRTGGYRGYTWKRNLTPGEWKVAVETENGRTVAVHHFHLSPDPLPAGSALVQKAI